MGLKIYEYGYFYPATSVKFVFSNSFHLSSDTKLYYLIIFTHNMQCPSGSHIWSMVMGVARLRHSTFLAEELPQLS